MSLTAKRGNLFSMIASVYPQAIVYSRLPQPLTLSVRDASLIQATFREGERTREP